MWVVTPPRYEAFEDDRIPKFMFGSHYCNVATVLFYLFRLEPFTSYARAIGGGEFDAPDRMFKSLPQAWAALVDDRQLSDVKELVPEMFFLPELFENVNGVAFGACQDAVGGADLGAAACELPPWANGSAAEFVRLHREALESEFVSRNLHHCPSCDSAAEDFLSIGKHRAAQP